MFSITQNLLNVTKNIIFSELNSKLKNIITNFLDSLLFCFDENKYIKALLQFEKDVYNLLSHSIDVIMNKGFLYDKTYTRPWVSSLGINSRNRSNIGGLKQKRLERRGKSW